MCIIGIEIFDQDGELVAMATILTLVQKKSPFPTITKSYLQGKLNALAESTQPKWGKMTAQHLVEHMEFFTQMALGNIETEITTPEKYMEKTQDSLWDYRSMLKEFDHPALKKGEVEDLRFGNLEEAKDAFWKAYEALEIWFKENPKGTVKNTVFDNSPNIKIGLRPILSLREPSTGVKMNWARE